jgi:NAD(P)-dependent dehydrogenase (short-subunit alcohol dehydrogenase family)
LSAGIINTESKLNAAINRHPLARIGNASEIAAMAALLLNPEGSWITGQVITIDGGLSVLK